MLRVCRGGCGPLFPLGVELGLLGCELALQALHLASAARFRERGRGRARAIELLLELLDAHGRRLVRVRYELLTQPVVPSARRTW